MHRIIKRSIFPFADYIVREEGFASMRKNQRGAWRLVPHAALFYFYMLADRQEDFPNKDFGRTEVCRKKLYNISQLLEAC